MRFIIKCCFNLLCLLSVFLVSTVDAQVCTPVAPGLVSWWSGDGNAFDSRSRINGTLQGGTTFAAGQVGQAIMLDGFDDFIQLPSDPSLVTTSITLEGWINANQIQPPVEGGFVFANRQQNVSEGFSVGVDSNQKIKIVLRTSSGVADVISVDSFQAGVFQHIAVTYNETSGILSAFLNGSPIVLNIPTPIGGALLGTNEQFIGQREQSGPLVGRFNGLIDELSIYNRVLSGAEIAAIHAAGTAGKCKPTATVAPSGVVGWWSGDGDANDISGFDNDGGLFNGAGHDIGRVGQAFSFDGLDDVVRIGSQAEHNVQTGNFSLEAWVNLRNYAVGSSFIAGKELCAGPSIYAMYVSNGGAPSMRLNNSSSASFFASGPVGGVGLNQWHHLVGTREGNTLRMYLDGVEVGSTALSGSFDAQGASFSIGERPDGLAESCRSLTNGLIDEVTLYDRALASAEVESIFNAGAGGKLKQSATLNGTNLISLWRGENNPLDERGNNNGSLSGVSFGAGRVGQAFDFDGVDDFVRVENSTSLNVQTGNFTLEAWVNLRSVSTPNGTFIAGKDGCGEPNIYSLFTFSNGVPVFRVNNSSGTTFFATASDPLTLNEWHHLVGVRDGNTIRLFVDGELSASISLSGTFGTQSQRFYIGERPDNPSPTCRGVMDGMIDEVAVYDTALGPAEVLANFRSGNALSTAVGDVRITFSDVSSPGLTQQIPLTGEGLPPIPTDPASALIYDIATSASYTGNIGLCFNLPSFSTADIFMQLVVVHLENGNWINRTTSRDFATRTVCAQTTTLSPFAIAPIAPTSAPVTVAGRVLSPNGNGIGNAVITLSDAATGATLVARSSPFGYYRFDGVAWGRTYIAEIRSKSHSFQIPVREITAFDDIADLDFIADPLFGRPGSKGSP